MRNVLIRKPVGAIKSLSRTAFNGNHAVAKPTRSYSSSTDEPPYWDYSVDHGPSNWGKYWKTGERQSPIDILTKLAKYDPNLKPFTIDYTPIDLSVKNIGVNFSVTLNDDRALKLKGGALENEFKLREFHFHWGENNQCGCEHALDGHKFAAELHLVHWNFKHYETEMEAIMGPNGLAVLGVFLDAQYSHKCNKNLDKLLGNVRNIPYQDKEFNFAESFSPYSLLPENIEKYFTYPGSLTTPPLTESVTWTVFHEPLKISMKQLEAFNSLYAVKESEKDKVREDKFCRSSGKLPQPQTITNNYRPVQPLNGRTVFSSFKI